jgi:hypothetical protein
MYEYKFIYNLKCGYGVLVEDSSVFLEIHGSKSPLLDLGRFSVP